MPIEPEAPIYSRPPVSEALIDIKVKTLPDEKIPKLEALHNQFLPKFPVKKRRFQAAGKINIEQAGISTTEISNKPVGFIFETPDKSLIVQVKTDGLTLNQIKPDPRKSWPGWESLRNEAKLAWERYLEVIGTPRITRLAIRYINQIVIESDNIDLEEYFTAPPKIPSELPQVQDMENFFSRVVFGNSDPKATVIIIQAQSPNPYEGKMTITLDIDIFREYPEPKGDESLWQTLDQFRILKNNIFEASLTQKTKALFN
ncbi:MAG: TIGR04255 family protein [Nitrospira sp.]|nr:TIGR04255 family protein [Nitrospira sp.]